MTALKIGEPDRRRARFGAIARCLPHWYADVADWLTVPAIAAVIGVSTKTTLQRLDAMRRAGLVERKRGRSFGGPFRFALSEKGARELRGG